MGCWREVQADAGSEGPQGRGGAACCAISDRRVLIYGGADTAPTTLDDWWLLELTDGGGMQWTKLSPVVKLTKKRKLLPRSGASLTFVPSSDGSDGGKAYLYGGQDPVAGVVFDDLLCLEVGSWELTDVPLQRPLPPSRHSHVAGVFEGTGVVVFGGAGLRGPLNDVWLLEPEQRRWRCLSADLAEDESPDGREMAAGTMISEAGLLVHGGRGADGDVLNDICIFDGRAARWVLVQPTWYARCAHTACNAAVQPRPLLGSVNAAGGEAQPAVAGQGAAAPTGTATGGGSSPVAGPAPPPASNVLLFGGFSGEVVAGDLLQLTFLRKQRNSGGFGLRAELRPVKEAEEGAPLPRFAHAAVVLSRPEAAELAVIGGVNQTDELADVHVWSV